MQRVILLAISILFFSFTTPLGSETDLLIDTDNKDALDSFLNINEPKMLYNQMELEGLICYDAFEVAYKGYKKLNSNNNPVLTVIDFNLPSTEKRMYVLNLATREVLFVSHVAHGRNSGDNFATSFSNKNGSYQSSLGFYRTDNTYNGDNGYSLRLDGLEKGINDNARQRAIVIHGADYCNENIIKSTGRLGRSFGCPALPREMNRPIIDTIKGGSLLFVYFSTSEESTSSNKAQS